MKKNIIYLLIIASLSVGCRNNNIEQSISKEVRSECKNDSCTITISQLTKFKWDKMYVFNSPISLELINQALGVKYPYYVEFTRPIIFLKGDKIVHYENNKTNLEGFIDGQVVFDYPDSLKYQVYRPALSMFKVKRKTLKDVSYYMLSQ